MKFTSRASYSVELNDGKLSMKKFLKSDLTLFDLSEISETRLSRNMYDIPFLEKTVSVILKNGKKYHFKRMPKAQAEELFKQLNSR